MGFFEKIFLLFGILIALSIVIGLLAIKFPKFGAALEAADQQAKYGTKSPKMVCPHCDKAGKIFTKQVKQKKGVSGGKATAAVLTAGVSMLATGLSRKEKNTQAHCKNCGNTWYF